MPNLFFLSGKRKVSNGGSNLVPLDSTLDALTTGPAELATGPIHDGSLVGSGFEHGTLRRQSPDLTTRPQRSLSNLKSRIKSPPVGVTWKSGKRMLTQVSYSSSDHGSKVRGLTQKSPHAASKQTII
ncbi:hypothetical protein AVEN_923-1 [Araneus ventricosus]|uniref:Uncharacterized protein n=1 Tax=Araneus ventricosus TaxID=182803 RepID=A0A4Y2Q0I3_ARAVE|nr:hypothetical protein AVEN_923-1 [Araneus ventricosus]